MDYYFLLYEDNVASYWAHINWFDWPSRVPRCGTFCL